MSVCALVLTHLLSEWVLLLLLLFVSLKIKSEASYLASKRLTTELSIAPIPDPITTVYFFLIHIESADRESQDTMG